jgi:hypothetical protein
MRSGKPGFPEMAFLGTDMGSDFQETSQTGCAVGSFPFRAHFPRLPYYV